MIIGITGGIASGKSTLSQCLKENGFQIVDADKIAYDALTIDESCMSQVKSTFDGVEIEGKIDRKKLGNIIFNDKDKQKQLEAIVHPYVIFKIKEAIGQCDQDILFLDIPLLYESSLEYLCDDVVVVYVDEKVQIERLVKRNQLSIQEAIARIHSQMPLIDKKNRANYVLDNNGSLEDFYQQIHQFINQLKKGGVPWLK